MFVQTCIYNIYTYKHVYPYVSVRRNFAFEFLIYFFIIKKIKNKTVSKCAY